MVGNSGSVSRPFVRRKQIGETGLAGTDISGRHPSIDAHRGGGGGYWVNCDEVPDSERGRGSRSLRAGVGGSVSNNHTKYDGEFSTYKLLGEHSHYGGGDMQSFARIHRNSLHGAGAGAGRENI